MKDVSRTIRLALSLVLVAAPLSAQSISFGLRGTGGFPTGEFAEDPGSASSALIQGAKQGFGCGADLGILGLVSMQPEVRYVGQNLGMKLPVTNTSSVPESGVNYFTFDLGLALHLPFGM